MVIILSDKRLPLFGYTQKNCSEKVNKYMYSQVKYAVHLGS